MLGDRLRTLRQERGLTLKQLAESTGLSVAMLSQIENNVTDPSLSSLRKLSEVFDSSIAALFSDPEAPLVNISRPGERRTLIAAAGGFAYERLTPGRGDLEVLKAEVPPGGATSPQPWSHPSTECVYVMSGTLTVEIGDMSHTLIEGEAITFDSAQPHRYVNNGDEDASIIVSVTPPTP